MSDVQELRKELKAWQARIPAREKAKAQAAVEQQQAARVLKRKQARFSAARRALHKARAAISTKRRQIKATQQPKGRAAALKWCADHLYKAEVPPGSNCIPWMPNRLGFGCVAWCGIWVANALIAGGVKNVTARLAGVALIEEDAKAGRYCFSGWSTDPRSAKPGDAVVLFGYGVHVEVVRAVGSGVLYTYGGNTSSGAAGSQSNGGGSYPRVRSFSDVRGIAQVTY